jgi:glycosyltransferase involved in cell wall biosynthesis
MAKILVVASPPGPLTLERAVVGQSAGHQIIWVSTPPVDLSGVTAFGAPTQTASWGRSLLEPFILLKAIRSARPDLVHAHYAWQGLRTPILLRCRPLVATVMGGDILPDQSYKGLRSPLVRALLNHADCITSKSPFLDGVLCRIGDYRDKIQRITWGVDLSVFHPDRDVDYLRRQWRLPADGLVFFDPRGARPLYNKHVILDAFARYLQAGGPTATLLVAEFSPDPTYLNRLKAQVEELGISDKMRFVGSIDHLAIPDYYALADVTISIPNSDGLPQTIFEAQACGSFLILSDLPQYAGTVEDGLTARCTPPDSQAVAEALLWAATQPDVRTRAAQAGRAYVEQHANRPIETQRVNQIYADLLQKYAKPM